eukprot:21965-Hanusia_phi.AAC.1
MKACISSCGRHLSSTIEGGKGRFFVENSMKPRTLSISSRGNSLKTSGSISCQKGSSSSFRFSTIFEASFMA